MPSAGEFELPARKKVKVMDLPLSSTQRVSIDDMLHTFKKKGEFDALRKKAFQQYNESAQRGMFEAALRTFTANEIERDPVKYLKPDRRMGAPLLEGAAARSEVYKKTEADIDTYINDYLATAERALRSIRRQDIGEDAAEEEVARGGKSDEAYAAEAEDRRKLRAKKHIEQEKVRRKQETQERKKKELEGLKKKQEELMKETERLQREQKRRAERDAWKAAEKEKEKERIKKYNEEREKQKKEADDREKALKEARDRRDKERKEREQKRLEEEALDLLLKEGKEMAERAKRPELERSESMEPPPRLTRNTGPTSSTGREDVRPHGLVPTSLTLKRTDKPGPTPTGPRASMPAPPHADDDRRRPLRARSPSPSRSTYSRRREPSVHDDERRSSRRDAPRRDGLYRDISAERAAWKARQRPSSRGEEGEVVEPRARSRSREPYRRRRESRSPPRRRPRDVTRSRTPPRRVRSPDRRQRSRSPPGIDRYVPGGAPARRSREDDEREADRWRRDDPRRRDDSRPRREGDRARRDDSRTRRDDRRRDDEYAERVRQAEKDRYVPGAARAGPEPRRAPARESSRDRARELDRDRARVREKAPEERSGSEVKKAAEPAAADSKPEPTAAAPQAVEAERQEQEPTTVGGSDSKAE